MVELMEAIHNINIYNPNVMLSPRMLSTPDSEHPLAF